MTPSGQWGLEDLDEVLASGLDSSLSGLGVATSTTFDMSKYSTLSESVMKEVREEKEQFEWNKDSGTFPSKVVKKTRLKGQSKEKHNGSHLSSGDSASSMSSSSDQNDKSYKSPTKAPLLCQSLSKSTLWPGQTMKDTSVITAQFQYVLGASTAMGCKIGEETLTYLNQGQSYEIRLKKLHDLSEMKGKLLKSGMHVGFQERRLQYREKAEISAWQNQRPRDRILDVDLSLSYGIFDVIPDPMSINSCEFMWDPTREASVFIRINCISTEFTCKRRGGEKGVPLRIVIETFSHWENPPRKLDSASCLVKVFKSKGADRKHKTDREKLEKLSSLEQKSFQPSYQCTVFTKCSANVEDMLVSASPLDPIEYVKSSNSSENLAKQEPPVSSPFEVTTSTPSSTSSLCQEIEDEGKEEEDADETDDSCKTEQFIAEASEDYLFPVTPSVEITKWLQKHRFNKFLSHFASFSGSDLLCLSREDLIQICGVADGIRLYNTLHVKRIRPQLTLFICSVGEEEVKVDLPSETFLPENAFHALYLENLTVQEVKQKISELYGFPEYKLKHIYITGPSGIYIYLSDKVVQNLKNESAFFCEVTKGRDDNKHHQGVGLLLSRHASDALLGYECINERFLTAKFQTSVKDLNVICCYAPTEDADEDEKDRFYEQLQDILNSVKKGDITLVLGDFNAKVGTDSDLWGGVIGPFGIGGCNGNGQRLLQMKEVTNIL